MLCIGVCFQHIKIGKVDAKFRRIARIQGKLELTINIADGKIGDDVIIQPAGFTDRIAGFGVQFKYFLDGSFEVLF